MNNSEKEKLIKFDRTVKLDHLITIAAMIFSLGVFYAFLTTSLDQKANSSDVLLNAERIAQNSKQIESLRHDNKYQFDRIERTLVRIEEKISTKADK